MVQSADSAVSALPYAGETPSHAQGLLVGSLMCHGHHHLLLCIGRPRLSMVHLHRASSHIAGWRCQPYWGGNPWHPAVLCIEFCWWPPLRPESQKHSALVHELAIVHCLRQGLQCALRLHTIKIAAAAKRTLPWGHSFPASTSFQSWGTKCWRGGHAQLAWQYTAPWSGRGPMELCVARRDHCWGAPCRRQLLGRGHGRLSRRRHLVGADA